MTVSNFAFVEQALPELHALGAEAEQTLDSASPVAMNCLKLMGRWMVGTVLFHEGIVEAKEEPMARLGTLINHEIVPEQWIATLKRLEYMDTRESELLLDPIEVKRLLFQMYDLTCWYYKTYVDDEYTPAPLHLPSHSFSLSRVHDTNDFSGNPQFHVRIDGHHVEAGWDKSSENEHTVQIDEGESYRGQWWSGMKHGTGVYRWSDGTSYAGQWNRDTEHGRGEKRYANGDSYQGEWRDGLFHGRGTYRWSDGTRYEGQWEDNMEHGYGVKTFRDGTVQKGLWSYGELVINEGQLTGGNDKD